jgi:hypothetical protein
LAYFIVAYFLKTNTKIKLSEEFVFHFTYSWVCEILIDLIFCIWYFELTTFKTVLLQVAFTVYNYTGLEFGGSSEAIKHWNTFWGRYGNITTKHTVTKLKDAPI